MACPSIPSPAPLVPSSGLSPRLASRSAELGRTQTGPSIHFAILRRRTRCLSTVAAPGIPPSHRRFVPRPAVVFAVGPEGHQMSLASLDPGLDSALRARDHGPRAAKIRVHRYREQRLLPDALPLLTPLCIAVPKGSVTVVGQNLTGVDVRIRMHIGQPRPTSVVVVRRRQR
jgi:hypothetical protein